ncbi:MAG: L-aspartate oxidase [Arcobacter sp.]|uniref:L-aspartate oxidase n=1 Tax=Arcobacter sp. TaxID=1872629 RepID=UPI003CFEEAF0
MIYDVIVVGGGIAGLMAAIEAKNENNKVALITKGNVFKSNSSMASGGINAVLDPNNTKEINQHINDTLVSGKGLGNKKAITYMCKQASKIISKLVDYGVEFDRNKDGSIAQRPFGGGSSNRTCYVGDKTGSAITMALIKKAKTKGITFLPNTYILNLAKYQDRVSGVIALNKEDSQIVIYPSKAVILAGGGYAGIYRGYSTNAPDYTGDLLAVALRAGLYLKDMEFVQFHPTGFVKTNYLVTEAARGEGGYLVNSEGNRFVNELGTRDEVARAILKEQLEGKKVFMDLRHLGLEKIQQKLPSLFNAALNQSGINLAEELLEIKPVAHYTMGGVDVNMTKCELKGLYVCGEMASNGVHGANRLGGNSLLEGCVFGELSGMEALKYSQENEYSPIDYNTVIKDIEMIDFIFSGDSTKNFNAIRISLGKTLFEKVGIIKNELSLTLAFDYVKYLRQISYTLHCINKEKNNNVELTAILELRNALEISEAIILSALKRKESRGAHFREDFPTTSKEYDRSFVVKELKKGFFKISFKENEILKIIKSLFINKE